MSSGRPKEPLPPALPPAERTVGQLVAESVRFYGSHFWRSLALGVPAAITASVVAQLARVWQLAFLLTAGAALLTLSYVGAILLVTGAQVSRPTLRRAFLLGFLVYLPAPFLSIFILPALAWLAFAGLAVPVAMLEGLGLRESFVRGTRLARADYVHALGSLATLAIVALLSDGVLVLLLRGAGEATIRVAAFLAQLVISPMLFVGAAMLYFDQSARAVGSAPRPRRRRDAQVPAADDADRPGRADAEGEPRPAARGQS